MSEQASIYTKAQRLLARRDPVIKMLIKQTGVCTLQPNPDGFATLVRSIIAQQISTKVATAIHGRLEQTLKRTGITPAAVRRATDDRLRGAGMSAAKVRSLRDLADKVHSGELPLDELHTMSDDEVIAKLIPVRGIGKWTAQMFLIFSLGRLDVLPVDDNGLRAGVQRHYHLEELPGKAKLMELAEPWQPYRTVGTWYIWRTFGNVPQSQDAENL